MQKSLIMIVDDDAVINDTLAALVKKLGHQSLQVFTATEASNILFNQQIKPELLICDVNLPGKSGFDLVKEVIIKNIQVDICMLSGQDERENRLAALQLGAIDFFSKPIDPEKFSALIKKILSVSAAVKPAEGPTSFIPSIPSSKKGA